MTTIITLAGDDLTAAREVLRDSLSSTAALFTDDAICFDDIDELQVRARLVCALGFPGRPLALYGALSAFEVELLWDLAQGVIEEADDVAADVGGADSESRLCRRHERRRAKRAQQVLSALQAAAT